MNKGYLMSRRSQNEFFKSIYECYHRVAPARKSQLLDDHQGGCRACGYNRKYAIRKLNRPASHAKPKTRNRTPRSVTYDAHVISILCQVWQAAGYPWSVRLQALLRVWRPWIRKQFHLTDEAERQLLAISPRPIDRRLKPFKTKFRKRLYGRTKPGTLLKHQIPVRTEHWDVTKPGFLELDLVAHLDNSADGDFIFSLNTAGIAVSAILPTFLASGWNPRPSWGKGATPWSPHSTPSCSVYPSACVALTQKTPAIPHLHRTQVQVLTTVCWPIFDNAAFNSHADVRTKRTTMRMSNRRTGPKRENFWEGKTVR